MSRSKRHLTNHTLLTVLWDRLPTFTREEWIMLMKILEPHQPKIMKIIQSSSPQVYDWIQEKHQQLDQEKADKKAEELKKSLADKN